MNRLNRILNFIGKYYATFIGSGLLVIVAFIIWSMVWPFVPAKINSVNVMDSVSAGGQITYQTDFCRYVRIDTKIDRHRYLVPEDKKLTSPIELSDSPIREVVDDFNGCKRGDVVKLPVEIGTPPGKYRLLIQICYYVFPWRCVSVEQRSDVFEISKPNVSQQLSAINTQLNTLNSYLMQNPGAARELNLGNVQSFPQIQSVTPPVTTPTEPQPAQRQGIVENTLDNTFDTVRDITSILRLQ